MLSQTTNQTPLLKLCFCQFLRHSGYYRHKTELSASALVSPSWSINTVSYQREQSCSDTVAPMHHLNFRAHRDFTEAAWPSCSLCCLLPGLVFLGSQRMLEILTSLKYLHCHGPGWKTPKQALGVSQLYMALWTRRSLPELYNSVS